MRLLRWQVLRLRVFTRGLDGRRSTAVLEELLLGELSRMQSNERLRGVVRRVQSGTVLAYLEELALLPLVKPHTRHRASDGLLLGDPRVLL